MGSGGVMSKEEEKKRAYSKPPFTISEIKKAIPPHCFHRSLLQSFSYLAYDLSIITLLYHIANHFIPLLPSPYRHVAWPLYWLLQGCVLTGVWVIAHECGHHALSDYQWVDDTVGFVLHSALLTPYFSWKYSHRRHHSNNASLDYDEGYVPKTKSQLPSIIRTSLSNPVGRVVFLSLMLTIGWPCYLAFNLSGRAYEEFACHYSPYSPIFNKSQRLQIVVSDVGVLAATYVLYRAALAKGLSWVVCMYGVPLVITYAFLVIITYLQHTHPSVPRYDSSEWEWLKAQLVTVDRDYGVLNKVFHNLTDTHVAHHLFTTMPHYHAMEATKAMKPVLGDYYKYDGTPFYKALWREVRECVYVEKDDASPNKGVFWYNNNFS